MASVAEFKKRIVKDIVNLVSEYPIIGVVNMENLPAPQLQKMRAHLREIIKFSMTKKRLIKIALDKSKDSKKDIEKLQEHFTGMPALIFTKENPFKLFRMLKKNKSPAPAKAGQIAPKDIIVPAGPTSFAPGPIISELSQIGIKAGVEGGKVAVKTDSVVAKQGEKIKPKVAEVLTRLGIQPMEVGLDLVAIYEEGTIYLKDVLDVDEDKFMADLKSVANGAFNLAIFVAYPAKDTIKHLISKAFNDAKALGVSQEVLDEGIIDELMAKAQRQMMSLSDAAKIGVEVPEKKPEPKPEVKKEAPKVEEKKPVEKPKPEVKKEEPKVEKKPEPKVEEKKPEVKEKPVEKPKIEPKVEKKPEPKKEVPAPKVEEKKEEKIIKEEKRIIEEEKQLEKEMSETQRVSEHAQKSTISDKPKEAPVEKEVQKAVKEEEEKQLEKERIEKEKELEKIEKQKTEEARKAEEQKKKAEEGKKRQEQQRKAEEAKRKEQEEQKRKQEEERKKTEEAKKRQEEQKRKEEDRKKAEEEKRQKELEKKKQEEEQRKAEEKKKKQEELRKKQEELKKLEEQEKKRLEEAKKKEDEVDIKVREMVEKTKKMAEGPGPTAADILQDVEREKPKPTPEKKQEIKKKEEIKKEHPEAKRLLDELQRKGTLRGARVEPEKKKPSKKEEKEDEQKKAEELFDQLKKKGTLREPVKKDVPTLSELSKKKKKK